MTKAIVNVAQGSWYRRGQERLAASARAHAPGYALAMYSDELPPGSPSHKDAPYAFKHHAMIQAKRDGHDVAIWCDAAVWFTANPQPIVDLAIERGLWIGNSTTAFECWASDDSLVKLGVKRDDLCGVPMPMGTMYALDLRSKLADDLFEYMLAHEDALKGSWTNESQQVSKEERVRGHRHDQVLLGVFCRDHAVPVDDFPGFLSFPRIARLAKEVALSRGM